VTVADPPEVSIIIPTRNRWRLLSTHALPSALNQVDVDIEILVVDDGSVDETPVRLSRITDPRLRVLPNTASPGVAGARNTGIAAARGAWVAFLDDDDLWAPGKLRAQLDQVDGRGSWIFSASIVVNERRQPLYSLPLPRPDEVASKLLGGNIVPSGPSNVVARTRFVREIGAFDETLVRHTEDWDFWLRLSRAEAPVVCADVHVASLDHEQRSALRGDWNVVVEAARLLRKQGPVTRRQLLSVAEWLAFEQHRGGHRLRAAGLYLRAAVVYRSPGNVVAAAGALLGERGIRVASAVLQALCRSSHLTLERRAVATVPEWLQLYGRDDPEPAEG
jgi:glycosyltransferase involved in cell wall biosynthesis